MHFQCLRQLFLTLSWDPWAHEGHSVSSKCPSRVQDGIKEVNGRNEREWCFPDEGFMDLPFKEINDPLQKGNREIIELVAS